MRKLVAALACRMNGSRLYGKPLQNLDVQKGQTILGHMIDLIRSCPEINDIVLGISKGDENLCFVDFAKKHNLKYIIGHEKDVLQRLIDCGKAAQATDIFRVTTESPYFYYEFLPPLWDKHVKNENDVTTFDGLPEGGHFEIYSMDALQKSHDWGEPRHRSEFCSLYIRENKEKFKVEIVEPPQAVYRLDMRLTVDYPEDLVLCRKVYEALKAEAPRFPMTKIIKYLDDHPEVKKIADPYVYGKRIW